MRFISRKFATAAMTIAVLAAPVAALAQGYFVPTPQRPAAPAAPARPAAPAPQPAAPPPAQQQDTEAAPIQAPMPPVPELPPLPRGPVPPAAAIGIIGVPEVMRASTAAQQVDKIIGDRREKLNAEAQKEQQTWRDMQQALSNDRAKLSPEQVRVRERELQDRITNAQRGFQSRSRIIQEAAQFGLNQIQASLIGVIRQVAESRGMNIVLHRAQVALNVNEFDITDQVVEQLNKLMPTVTIPPEGVSPNAQQTAPAATPVTPATAPKKP
jgi:Skp family chaperone for outer membrane proteins